jgi:hypothetical protein
MLRRGHAGCFHSGRTINGRSEALYKWRVTTDSLAVARATARRLGGDVRDVEDSPHGQWEVLTESPVAEIALSKATDREITFSLPGETALGEFFFGSDMWNPEQISKMAAVCDSNSMRCELSLKPVEFKTRTGLTVLYILPSIEFLVSAV